MRAAAVLIGLGAGGFLAGHALAVSSPIPTVPTVTVTTPRLPAPTVTVPKLPPVPTTTVPKLPPVPTTTVPKTTAPKPPAAPAPPTPRPTITVPSIPLAPSGSATPAPSAPVTQTLGGSTPIGSAAGSHLSGPSAATGLGAPAAPVGASLSRSGGRTAGSSSAPSAAPASTKGARLPASRSWIATKGPKSRRQTILTFVLPRAGRVVFTVRQVAPVCRIAERFVVRGHRGVNRIRFPRPTSRLELAAGTYRISAHAFRGRFVRRMTLVVVGAGKPTPLQIAAARSADVCAPAPAFRAPTTGGPSSGELAGQPSAQVSTRTPEPQTAGPSLHAGGVLGASVERTARAIRPLLVGLLALAIVLLGIASLPRVATPESRAGDLLATHRSEIAGLGAAALVAVVITFLVG
jgi:hypothetical protein